MLMAVKMRGPWTLCQVRGTSHLPLLHDYTGRLILPAIFMSGVLIPYFTEEKLTLREVN